MNGAWLRFPEEDGIPQPPFPPLPSWAMKEKIEIHKHSHAICSLLQGTQPWMNRETQVHQRPKSRIPQSFFMFCLMLTPVITAPTSSCTVCLGTLLEVQSFFFIFFTTIFLTRYCVTTACWSLCQKCEKFFILNQNAHLLTFGKKALLLWCLHSVFIYIFLSVLYM